jgi:hypothetical protein
MSSNEYALSLKTNRLVKKSTANYRKLKKLNLVKEVENLEIEEPIPIAIEEPNTIAKTGEPEFDESLLQQKLADISTDMIHKNIKKIVKSQKLSDSEMDTLLRKMLYAKLCEQEPPKKAKVKAKKYKVVEPSSSESDE